MEPKPLEPKAAAAPTEDADAARDKIFASSDLPQLIDKPLAGDPMRVTIHRLENGMTVYIATNRQEPSVVARVAVRAGGRHDPADSTGLAHYLEHMLLFKGTDEIGTISHDKEKPHLDKIRDLYRDLAKAKSEDARQAVLAKIDAQTQKVAAHAVTNEYSRIYGKLGVSRLNAFTNKERTYYIATVPTNRVPAWAMVEGERFADPVFRLFYPELEAVYEEKNRGMDSPFRTMHNTMLGALYPKHAYGTQSILGEVEHLKTPAFDDMVAFFGRWYVPNNMAIILSGDVDASVLPLLENSFGRLKPRALEPPAKGALPPLKGRTAKEFRAPGAEQVRIAWQTVPAGHKDLPALELVDRLLSDGTTGMLRTQLVTPGKVQAAFSDYTPMHEAGFADVTVTTREGQTPEQAEALIRGVIAGLETVSREEVEAAKINAAIDRKTQEEFPVVVAQRLLDAFIRHEEWKDVVAYRKALSEVTVEQVRAAAARYLGENSVVVYRRRGEVELPKITKPKISKLEIDPKRESAFAKKVAALPAEPLQPDWLKEGDHYARRDLPAGPLFATKNERNDLFMLEYRFDRGYRKAPMLCTALGLQERAGAGKRSADALQAELYALGATVFTNCSLETSALHLRGPDKNLEAILALVDDWFREPKFTEAVRREHIDSVLDRRKSWLEDEQTLTDALEELALFGPHAWGRQIPTNRALQRASSGQLRREIASFFDFEHRTAYFGPRSADAVAKVVARGTGARKTGPRRARKYRATGGPVVYFLDRKQAKASVNVALPGAALPASQTPDAALLLEYLGGGSNALVFQEIRTARGLAYAARGGASLGRPGDEAVLWGWMQNQNDKVAEALPALLEIMRRPKIDGPRFAESRRAQVEEWRSTRINVRFSAWAAEDFHQRGHDGDPRPEQFERLQKLTVEDAEAFAAKFIAAHPIVTVIGDREQIDMAALRKVGPVVEVKPKNLYHF